MDPQPKNKTEDLLQVEPSATLAINERSKHLIACGHEVFRFGFGESPFPVPDSVVQALQTHAHEKSYVEVQGLKRLREAVAGYYKRDLGLAIDPGGIMIGPGSKELIFLIQLATKTGLILGSPSWVSYAPQANICQKSVAWIHTHESDGWLITPQQLTKACLDNPNHRLLILNHPSNPTGSTIDRKQLEELAQVASQFKLMVISDEIYGPLQFNGTYHTMAQWYPQGTIITGGLSKWCGAGGWRLGTAAFPEALSPLLQSVKALASETFTAVSAPIQFAAISAYTGSPQIQDYLQDCRLILRTVALYAYRKLHDHHITTGEARGGFYLFPNFENYRDTLAERQIHDSPALCERLLEETGVALLPGTVFGRPRQELTARLAFVDFDGKYALQWLQQNKSEEDLLSDLMGSCCPQMIQGLDRMCHWFVKMAP